MTYGRVSPKYQIVIPKEIRNTIAIKPGQRIMIYAKDNIICLIPEVGAARLKGILKGMDTSGLREEEDRM